MPATRSVRTREAGRDEHRTDLVAVKTGCVGLVVQAWPADMHRRRSLEQSFVDGVAVKRGDRAQSARDRRPRPTEIQLTCEGFDVVAGDIKQRQLALLAPRRELAKIRDASGRDVALRERAPRELDGASIRRRVPFDFQRGRAVVKKDPDAPTIARMIELAATLGARSRETTASGTTTPRARGGPRDGGPGVASQTCRDGRGGSRRKGVDRPPWPAYSVVVHFLNRQGVEMW